MALHQNPPQWFTRIQWTSGDWIVIAIKQTMDSVPNQPYKVNGWDDYANGGTKDGEEPLEKYPFDASKPASFKADTLKDHNEWRGNKDDGSDGFTALYFINNDKKKSQELELEFPGLGAVHPSTDTGYYVWPTEPVNGQTIAPPASAEEALGPYPYNPSFVLPYIAAFNWVNSWFESWDGWISQIAPLVGSNLPPMPTGNHYGWTTLADAVKQQQALNTYANWFNSQPGAGVNFFLWPHYMTLTFDYGSAPPPPGGGSVTYQIDAYRIRRNNIVFDEANKFKFKVPAIGKLHRTFSFTQSQPSDTRKIKVTWAPEPGIAINS